MKATDSTYICNRLSYDMEANRDIDVERTLEIHIMHFIKRFSRVEKARKHIERVQQHFEDGSTLRVCLWLEGPHKKITVSIEDRPGVKNLRFTTVNPELYSLYKDQFYLHDYLN